MELDYLDAVIYIYFILCIFAEEMCTLLCFSLGYPSEAPPLLPPPRTSPDLPPPTPSLPPCAVCAQR